MMLKKASSTFDHVEKLCPGWILINLVFPSINLSPNNRNLRSISVGNANIIVGKSDLNNDDYDLLLNVLGDVGNLIINSSIKRICQHSLEKCEFNSVTFQENSQVEIIEEKIVYYFMEK